MRHHKTGPKSYTLVRHRSPSGRTSSSLMLPIPGGARLSQTIICQVCGLLSARHFRSTIGSSWQCAVFFLFWRAAQYLFLPTTPQLYRISRSRVVLTLRNPMPSPRLSSGCAKSPMFVCFPSSFWVGSMSWQILSAGVLRSLAPSGPCVSRLFRRF